MTQFMDTYCFRIVNENNRTISHPNGREFPNHDC